MEQIVGGQQKSTFGIRGFSKTKTIVTITGAISVICASCSTIPPHASADAMATCAAEVGTTKLAPWSYCYADRARAVLMQYRPDSVAAFDEEMVKIEGASIAADAGDITRAQWKMFVDRAQEGFRQRVMDERAERRAESLHAIGSEFSAGLQSWADAAAANPAKPPPHQTNTYCQYNQLTKQTFCTSN